MSTNRRTGDGPPHATRARRLFGSPLTLAACVALSTAWAQAQQPQHEPVRPGAATPQQPADAANIMPPDMVKQIEAAGVPMGDMLARNRRMSDPNAGKRPGDEKLSCEQIKAEFDETNRKYTVQSDKQDAANAAVEAEAAKLQAESSGAGAVTKGFFVGLAALTAQVTGNGDAFNEKAKADVRANEARKQAALNQAGQEAEATKALVDRGETLMSLGKHKGCKGIAVAQPPKQLP
jgi:hypothetical protein